MERRAIYISSAILFLFVSVFLFTVSIALAAQNATLNLEGQTQGDSSNSGLAGSATLQSSDPNTESKDKDHKGEIDILSAGATDNEPDTSSKGMNKPDLVEGVVPVPIPTPVPTSDPETPGIEHEDIGITSRDDDDNDDTEDAGNVETEFKVEKGEKAADEEGKSSGGVIIKGSKIKENYVVPEGGEIGAPEEVKTDTDLENYLQKSAHDDENIEEIKSSDKEVTVKYTMPAKLFGFIPINMAQEATITFGDGERGSRVKVRFPWWRIFAREPVSENSLEESIEDEIDKVGLDVAPLAAGEHDPGITILESQTGDGDPDRPVVVGPPGEEISENVTLNFAKIKAQAFQTISNIMKARHEAAKNAVNNVR